MSDRRYFSGLALLRFQSLIVLILTQQFYVYRMPSILIIDGCNPIDYREIDMYFPFSREAISISTGEKRVNGNYLHDGTTSLSIQITRID